MKSKLFGELKDKILRATDVDDDDDTFDIDDDEYDDEYEDAAEEQGTNNYSSDYKNDDYSYKYDTADYTKDDSSSYNYGSYTQPKKSSYDSGKFTKKKGTNIYQMNNNIPQAIKVSRVVYFYLEDREDARNIADCMVAQDAVVLLDMSKLDKEDSMCVLHFLDGVKYIYKSKMETIASNVYLIVPNSIELAGDFYDQVSPGTFY
ncbi:MAG: cell division protein SepF [Oscillospiraceae bacterium]|nr:cell division protein SepF [Oscillospiraceae bacterium]MDD6526732.1 cell division protein SepF [Oscillospiraceae bacterium]